MMITNELTNKSSRLMLHLNQRPNLSLPTNHMKSHGIFPSPRLPILSLSLFLIISFTLLPIISSPHFPIISEARAATYYVDATNGNDANTGLSPSPPWHFMIQERIEIAGQTIKMSKITGYQKARPLPRNFTGTVTILPLTSRLLEL